MNKETQKSSIWKNCITIPNMLSVFRLILIPFFVYAYCVEQNFWKTAALLALSGISDTADGYIARRFNMVSDLGKIIDPVADKLTQAAMMLLSFVLYIIRNAKALKAGAGFTHGNDVPLASMREIKAEK